MFSTTASTPAADKPQKDEDISKTPDGKEGQAVKGDGASGAVDKDGAKDNASINEAKAEEKKQDDEEEQEQGPPPLIPRPLKTFLWFCLITGSVYHLINWNSENGYKVWVPFFLSRVGSGDGVGVDMREYIMSYLANCAMANPQARQIMADLRALDAILPLCQDSRNPELQQGACTLLFVLIGDDKIRMQLAGQVPELVKKLMHMVVYSSSAFESYYAMEALSAAIRSPELKADFLANGGMALILRCQRAANNIIRDASLMVVMTLFVDFPEFDSVVKSMTVAQKNELLQVRGFLPGLRACACVCMCVCVCVFVWVFFLFLLLLA